MAGMCECLMYRQTGADVNSLYNDGFTGLIRAAQKGHDQCMNIMIHEGSDVKMWIYSTEQF